MRIEIPEPKRCCCCLPLRPGLIFLVYFELFLLAIPLLILSVSDITSFVQDTSRRSINFHNILTVGGIIVSLLEVAFCILFLVGAHRKNARYMRIYYRYLIGMFVFSVFMTLAFAGFLIYLFTVSLFYLFVLRYLVEVLCLLVAQTGMQIYIIILVRSEVRKLENNSKFEFINHTSEATCNVEIIS